MTLSELAIILLLITGGIYLWKHIGLGQKAYRAAKSRTEEVGVNLLDQSVVLRGVRVRRSPRSLFAIERRFSFEFSTVGDVRYPGEVTLLGDRLTTIQLAPFKPPERQTAEDYEITARNKS